MDSPAPHTISLNEGQTFAKTNKIPVFLEVSAKSKENLDVFFTKVAAECFQRRNTFTKVVRDGVKLQ